MTCGELLFSFFLNKVDSLSRELLQPVAHGVPAVLQVAHGQHLLSLTWGMSRCVVRTTSLSARVGSARLVPSCLGSCV